MRSPHRRARTEVRERGREVRVCACEREREGGKEEESGRTRYSSELRLDNLVH